MFFHPGGENRLGAGLAGKGDGEAMGDTAPERGDIDRGIWGVGIEIGLIPELVVQADGEEKGIGDGADQHIASGGDIEAAFSEEEGGGKPSEGVENFWVGEALGDAQGGRAGGVGGDLPIGKKVALAAFDVVDATVQVVAGADG